MAPDLSLPTASAVDMDHTSYNQIRGTFWPLKSSDRRRRSVGTRKLIPLQIDNDKDGRRPATPLVLIKYF